MTTICTATCKNGKKCTYKAKVEDLCWLHYNSKIEGLDAECRKTECSICYELIGKGKMCLLACNHVYHRDCITPWITKNQKESFYPTCPYCREDIEQDILDKYKIKDHPDFDREVAGWNRMYQSGLLVEVFEAVRLQRIEEIQRN
jgi:hypothetical protein